MLQQLPQASHSLKNLLEEEWNFTKVITPYIRGGEAQSGKLFWLVSVYTHKWHYSQVVGTKCIRKRFCKFITQILFIGQNLSEHIAFVV